MPIKNVKLGKDAKIWNKNLVNLYGCEIGDSLVGAFVEIQKNVKIGNNCKIESHSFICEGVTIEDDVFIGHNVNFINSKRPKATNNGKLQTEDNWIVIPTIIKTGASIGTGSTIMCGITIGEGALIGAGSIVTKNVPPGETWVGNPARKIR